MKRYDSYKDSGVKWLGEIPSHWECVKLKSLCSMFGRIGFRGYSRDDLVDEGEGAITLSPSNFVDGYLNYSNCSYLSWKKYYESPEIMVENGDIVFVKTASIGKVAIVKNLPEKTTINPQILVFKHIKCNASYLNYYLQSKFIQGWIVAGANGSTISTISQVEVGKYPIFLAPFPEQEAIAIYLDSATSKIDEAIAQQQKMIDLLNERKQIIINNAVTKGLNPNVKMKPSGIDWIGDIPEHWEVKKLKHVCQAFGRIGFRGYSATDLVDEGEGCITLSPSNMRDGKMLYNKCTYLSWEKYEESPEIKIFNGNILFVKTGSTYGKSSLVQNLPMEATINPQLLVFKRFTCFNEFLADVLQTNLIQTQVELSVIGGTIPTISQQKILNYVFPFPPINEQKLIVFSIENTCAPINEAIKVSEMKISLLQERKQIIINDVVTGKVKVV